MRKYRKIEGKKIQKIKGENARKYVSVSISEELHNGKTITYKLKFTDRFRFILTSLSSFVDNLSEIYSKKYRDKNCKSMCDFIGFKNSKLHYKCKKCKKGQLKPINELIKKFSNTYKFCNEDINKFDLLLRKGLYPYEYMDSWERFDETSLPDEKAFNSELYLENITDKDYTHAQKVFKECGLKIKVINMTCMFKIMHYCLQMCLKSLKINVLEYMNLTLLIFCLQLD